MMSSLQRRVMETTSPAPTQLNNDNNNTRKNATNIEACFSTGLDLSDFGGNINPVAAGTTISASAALAKIKSDAAARIRREEQEEAALERRVAAVGGAIVNDEDGNITDSKDSMPRALHPNSQPSSMAGEERNNNFIQFQTAGGNGNFLSSLVTTHKTEGREISNKSRMMLKSNSRGSKVKAGQRIGSGGRSRQSNNNNNVKQKTSGKSVVKKSSKSKTKF